MTLLDNKNTYLEEDNQEGFYEMPAVTRKERDEGIPFGRSVIISTILHPATLGVIILASFILQLMGITFFKLPKPDFKKDIEFVLVQDEGTPRDPKTKNRADINSRSGGVNDPKRPVSMPSAPAVAQKPSPAPSKPQPKQQAKPKFWQRLFQL